MKSLLRVVSLNKLTLVSILAIELVCSITVGQAGNIDETKQLINDLSQSVTNIRSTTDRESSTVPVGDVEDLKTAKSALKEHDYDRAFKLLLPLANKGYVEASCELAEMYEFGYGVPQNSAEALKWYKMAARQGGKAKFSVRLASYKPIPTNKSELKRFVETIKADAIQGDSEAQRVLGTLFFKGLGLKRDFHESITWYKKSAEQGNAAACSNVGFMYQHGAGISQDYKQAVRYYQKATDLGDPEGTNNLGFMYARGLGVQKNPQEAIRLFKLAYEQGNLDAASNLGWMHQKGLGVPKDYKKAVELYAKAAANGVPAAQYNLGFMYQYGYGVHRDINKSMKHYLLASSKDHPAEENALGFMYEYGKGEPKDYNEALKWYKKKAQRELRAFIHWDLLEMPD